MSYLEEIRKACMCGSEEWCMKESEMGILQRTERSICGVQLIDEKKHLPI